MGDALSVEIDGVCGGRKVVWLGGAGISVALTGSLSSSPECLEPPPPVWGMPAIGPSRFLTGLDTKICQFVFLM